MRASARVYYDFDNKNNCTDIYEDSSAGLDTSGWNVLACTDMVMPMETDGVNDFF